MEIIIAIVVTFIVTVLWQKWADKRNKLPLRITLQGLNNELNMLSKQLGYEDIVEYWKATKGNDYAQIALIKI